MRKETKGRGWEQSTDCESSIRSRVRRKSVLCGVQEAASSSQCSSGHTHNEFHGLPQSPNSALCSGLSPVPSLYTPRNVGGIAISSYDRSLHDFLRYVEQPRSSAQLERVPSEVSRALLTTSTAAEHHQCMPRIYSLLAISSTRGLFDPTPTRRKPHSRELLRRIQGDRRVQLIIDFSHDREAF